MPDELQYVIHDIFDPGTLPGAAFYGVVFAGMAWLLGRAVRLAVHRALDGHVPLADPTAVTFLGQLARLAIYVVAFLSYAYHIPVLRQLAGVWLTGVGVISVVVGIAAQSTLGNLIAGISLLLYRPFRLGDRMQVSTPAGVESGLVESLTLGYTVLVTDDNQRIVIPNSVMASQTSINISARVQRATAVVSVVFGPAADIGKARGILSDLAKADARVTEVASCRVTAVSDAGTTVTLTAWCADATVAAEVKSDLLEAVKKRCAAEGMPISH